jgi:hypothetical protein
MTASSNAKPSLHWRGVLRSAMCRPPTDEQEFFEFCTTTYADEKRALEETLARGASERDISGARLGVYVIALVLLTYGRLDVIGDVLENVPPDCHPANRGLAPAVDRLIPVPAGLHAGTSPRDVLGWILANESHLRWDEDAGRFVLEKA